MVEPGEDVVGTENWAGGEERMDPKLSGESLYSQEHELTVEDEEKMATGLELMLNHSVKGLVEREGRFEDKFGERVQELLREALGEGEVEGGVDELMMAVGMLGDVLVGWETDTKSQNEENKALVREWAVRQLVIVITAVGAKYPKLKEAAEDPIRVRMAALEELYEGADSRGQVVNEIKMLISSTGGGLRRSLVDSARRVVGREDLEGEVDGVMEMLGVWDDVFE